MVLVAMNCWYCAQNSALSVPLNVTVVVVVSFVFFVASLSSSPLHTVPIAPSVRITTISRSPGPDP